MPAAGDRVGEYILEAKVGAGTFGEVWRARHHAWTDKVVAVKVPTDPAYVRALQREGVAIHGLEHPNIVRAINFDPYATPPYLAMEFVEGTSLREWIARGPMPHGTVAAILREVLAGLGYAHAAGMIHRDLKPENILIRRDAEAGGFGGGSVKLTDFGLGQKTTQFAAESIAYTASIEQGSALAGTIAYMSPEQRTAGAALDGRSDLYAVGVILFEMLTGERPAGTELPSDLVRDLPRGYDDVFRKAYARLASRYTSADEFAADLRRAAVVGGGGPPPLPGSGAEGVLGTCPKCRRATQAGDQFCMHCGCQLVDRVRRCTTCGAYPHPSDRFCMICGKPLGADSGVTLPAGHEIV